MRTLHLITPFTLGLLFTAACGKGPEPAPAAAPTSKPPIAAATTSTPTAAPAVSASPPPAPAAASEYPMCGGQRVAQAAAAPRAGAVSAQLAPAFLDEMTSCKATDVAPKDVIARAGEGSIDAKGDCVFASVGVSCHYHSGSEFVTTSTKAQTPRQGELHCIFPSSDPKSPHVFGAHVTCSDPARGTPTEPSTHAVHAGASCNAALLEQLQHCTSSRCCDDGTLTNPISDLVRDGKNDVRPDFTICEQPLTFDCSLLENLSAHAANSPALGGVAKPVFAAGAHHGAEKAPAKHAKAPGAGH